MFVDAAQTLINPTGTPSGSQHTADAENMPRARASAGKARFNKDLEFGNDFSRMLTEVR